MTDDSSDSMCLFFDEQGNGPSEIKLFKNDIREISDNGEVVSPRAFGLRWRVTGLLHFVEDGGFMLEERTVKWLRDQLTAWLDAPRLAARATPEVVAQIDEYALIRTSAGEWGIRWREGDDGGDEWNEFNTSEAFASAEFRDLTGAVRCESCARFIDHDDAECDDDGIYTCADETACSAAHAAKESK